LVRGYHVSLTGKKQVSGIGNTAASVHIVTEERCG